MTSATYQIFFTNLSSCHKHNHITSLPFAWPPHPSNADVINGSWTLPHVFPLSITQALPRHVNTHHGLPLRIPRLQQADRAVRSAMGISFCTGSLEIVYYTVTWHGINTLHVGDSSTATLELTRSNFWRNWPRLYVQSAQHLLFPLTNLQEYHFATAASDKA